MTDWRKKTLETYNKSAVELAEYFSGIGARTNDINRAFGYVNNIAQPNVLELGCGDGRDAAEIANKTQNYVGIDPSIELLKIARKKVVKAKFDIGGAVEYNFAQNLDIIFAFASLLHLDIDELKTVFNKATKSLNVGGIFYISLKYRRAYTEEIKKDQYGERQFFFYNPDLIKRLAGKNFNAVYLSKQHIGSTDWFTIALMRNVG